MLICIRVLENEKTFSVVHVPPMAFLTLISRHKVKVAYIYFYLSFRPSFWRLFTNRPRIFLFGLIPLDFPTWQFYSSTHRGNEEIISRKKMCAKRYFFNTTDISLISSLLSLFSYFSNVPSITGRLEIRET